MPFCKHMTLFLWISQQDATIVLFDVGANTKECDESSSLSFYEQAKKCVDSIIMRKVNLMNSKQQNLKIVKFQQIVKFSDFDKAKGWSGLVFDWNKIHR